MALVKKTISKDLHATLVKEKEFERFQQEYDETVEKYTDLSNLILADTTKLEVKIKKTKLMLTYLMKDQVNYYTEILKKGIDVRSEGLCWIVRRLIELNGAYDYQSFPRFLENYHIDYIIKLAKKQTESIHYKVILKIMKSKQLKLRQERDSSRLSCSSSFCKPGEINNIQETQNDNNYCMWDYLTKAGGFYRQSLSTKIQKTLDSIFKKNSTMMKINYEQKMEDIQVIFIYFKIPFRLKF